MAEDYTSEGLLAKVSNYSLENITTTSAPYTKDQVLSLADDKIRTHIVPFIQALREDYYLTYTDVTLVTDVTSYSLPSDAIASKVRLVVALDASNQETYQFIWVPLGHTLNSDYRGLTEYTFHFRGDKIEFSPYPTGAAKVRIYYYVRPRKLVASENYYTIASLVDADQFTVTPTIADSWFAAGEVVDIQSQSFPYDIVGSSTLSLASGTSVTTSANYDSDVEAGDIVVEPGTTAFPQIPLDCFPWLARLVAAEILKARGDLQAAQVQIQSAQEEEAYLRQLYTPRADGHPKVVTSLYNIFRISKRRY